LGKASPAFPQSCGSHAILVQRIGGGSSTRFPRLTPAAPSSPYPSFDPLSHGRVHALQNWSYRRTLHHRGRLLSQHMPGLCNDAADGYRAIVRGTRSAGGHDKSARFVDHELRKQGILLSKKLGSGHLPQATPFLTVHSARVTAGKRSKRPRCKADWVVETHVGLRVASRDRPAGSFTHILALKTMPQRNLLT